MTLFMHSEQPMTRKEVYLRRVSEHEHIPVQPRKCACNFLLCNIRIKLSMLSAAAKINGGKIKPII